MWKTSSFYEKVHDSANLGATLLYYIYIPCIFLDIQADRNSHE